MSSQIVSQQTDSTAREATRLHYLDWLRVIAILGVFLFHALNVFNEADFLIKNAERSTAITVFQGFLFSWGIPLLFLITGTGSWFALRRRTVRQYVRERFNRLLVPFVVGSIVFTPIQLYLEWTHKLQTGALQGSFQEFLNTLPVADGPRFFGAVGYHLWFVGFLFSFVLITLPIFLWLKGEAGKRIILRLAELCEHRGGLLLFILPLAVVRLGIKPFFPYQNDWSDFSFLMSFFLLGYVLFADERFTRAIRRDWPIMLTVGIAAFLAAAAIIFSTGEFDIEAAPHTLLDFIWWGLFTVCSWCWSLFVLFVGMRFLDFSSRWLQYSQDAIVPFYVVQQPVIIVIAFFVVQWEATLLIKLLAVVLSAFVVSIGLYELIIKRVGLLRNAFGMKATRRSVLVTGKAEMPYVVQG